MEKSRGALQSSLLKQKGVSGRICTHHTHVGSVERWEGAHVHMCVCVRACASVCREDREPDLDPVENSGSMPAPIYL